MTTRGDKVLKLASQLIKQLKPHSKKISIAGSIRRHSLSPGDIDIVLIPKDREKLHKFMSKKANFVQGGKNESSWKIKNVQVELYYTNEEEWGATLLSYSSPKGSEIGLRIISKNKGFRLSSHGLFNRRTGKRIAGKTEKEIYKALGRPYKEPWNR